MHGTLIRWAYYCIFRAANAPDLGDTVMGCLGLQIATPSLAVLTASALHIAANPILAVGAGATLAIARALRDRQKAGRDLKSSPLAYLIRAEENLQPKQMFNWVRAAAQKFRFF